MATNGAEIVASELMVALLTDVDVTVPTIDISGLEFQIPGDTTSDAYDVLLKLTNADLTTGAINGTGSFDKLMVGVAAQLQGEYDAGRITGVEYSKAYITLTQSALATSLQFLLGKDASYWQAVQAQTQAVIARVQLATVKAENARAQIEALTAKSNYALTKLKLATEDVQYGSLKYKLDNIDPLQVTQLTLQNSGITTSNLGLSINNDIASYNLTTTLPKQSLMLDAQTAQTTAQTDQVAYTTTSLMPAQLAQTTAQTSHIGKQELATVQQTSNLESQQAQVETETNKLIYELTYRIPEEVQLIKLNQDQVIAQNNKVATDTIIAIKQGHLVDAQTCQVSSETNRIKAEVALKLPEEVELVKLNQLQLTAQTDQTTYTTQHLLPAQLAQITGETSKINYEVLNILPKQGGLLTEQTLQVTAQTYGVTKTNVGIDTANSIASYNLTTVLPAQVAMTDSQKIGQDTANSISEYNLENLLPVQLATANAQKLSIDTANSISDYNLENILPAQLAMTSAQKLSVDKANSISDYNLATVLPSQVSMTNAQKLGQDKQTETTNYTLINLLPKQVDLLDEQIAGAVKDTETKTYTLDEIMPVQKLNLQEQAEAQRGQTMNTRSDGTTPITGSIGKQNELYAQQVDSYQKDSQLKAAKVFSDVWITCRSIDEGFPLPTQFDTAATQAAMQAIIAANGLGG